MTQKFKFYKGQVPSEADFSRVHALLVTRDERVLLRYKGGEARITGGHIDPDDRDMQSALKREILEECQVEIDCCDYVGYIRMEDSESHEVELWARMVARVDVILPPAPDPDREGNWIYGRALVPPEIALSEMMESFPTNKDFLPAALEVARQKNYFTELPNKEYEMLNAESRD